MPKSLHVVFDGVRLRLEEPVDPEPNARYLATIKRKETIDKQNVWDVLSKYARTVEGLDDWSEEHDHYLYGVPRK